MLNQLLKSLWKLKVIVKTCKHHGPQEAKDYYIWVNPKGKTQYRCKKCNKEYDQRPDRKERKNKAVIKWRNKDYDGFLERAKIYNRGSYNRLPDCYVAKHLENRYGIKTDNKTLIDFYRQIKLINRETKKIRGGAK